MKSGFYLLLSVACAASYPISTMRGVLQPLPNEELIVSTALPVPSPGFRQVLVKVHYAAVNRMDLVQAKGLYAVPPGASPILGVEVSGVIVSLGDACELGLQVGDNVMALLEGGGYAEYALSDERTVMPLLPGIDMLKSSAIPEAFMTAHQLLYSIAKVVPGDSVLIHAAASSIGQAAIQLAAKKGVTVIATTRSADKLETCISLGAHFGYVVDSNSSFSKYVLDATGGRGVDVILDPVGSSYLRDNLEAISVDGRLVLYGLLSGGVLEADINNNSPSGFFRTLLFKRVSILPTTLRSRSFDYKANLIKRLREDTEAGFPAISQGMIDVHISAIFSLDDVKDAHTLMARNVNIGKIILSMEQGKNSDVGEL